MEQIALQYLQPQLVPVCEEGSVKGFLEMHKQMQLTTGGCVSVSPFSMFKDDRHMYVTSCQFVDC